MGTNENHNIDENFTSFTFKKEISKKEENKDNRNEYKQNLDSYIGHSSNGSVVSLPSNVELSQNLDSYVGHSFNGNGVSSPSNMELSQKLSKIENTLDFLATTLQNLITQTNDKNKDNEILQKISIKIEQLEHNLENVQNNVTQIAQQNDKQNNEQIGEEKEEVLNVLRTNNLFLSKIEQKIEQNQKIKLQDYKNNADEFLSSTQSYNLFLSKIEKKLDLLYKLQQNSSQSEQQEEEDILQNIKTNNLFLSKIEQKIEVLSKNQTKYQNQNQNQEVLQEILEKSQTNALYIAKSAQKIDLFERMMQALQQNMQDPNKNEILEIIREKLENNAYLLPKLEQKLDLMQKKLVEQNSNFQNIETDILKNIGIYLNDQEKNYQNLQQSYNDLLADKQDKFIIKIGQEYDKMQNEQEILKNQWENNFKLVQEKIQQFGNQPDFDFSPLLEQQKQEYLDLKNVSEENNRKMTETLSNLKTQVFDSVQSYNVGFTEILVAFKKEIEKFFSENKPVSQNNEIIFESLTEINKNLLRMPSFETEQNNILNSLKNLKEEVIGKLTKEETNVNPILILENIQNTIGNSIENAVKNIPIQTNVNSNVPELLAGVERNLVKVVMDNIPLSQKNIIETLPTKDFWEGLSNILQNNQQQLQVIEQNILNFAKEKEQTSTQGLLNGIHTNNLYLSKMEQKFESLLSKINNQSKPF